VNWILWQNIVSPHLSPIARALASMPGQTVTIVAENEMPERRLRMGWHTPDCFPAHVVIKPTEEHVERLIAGDAGADQRERPVHLMNGLPGVPLNRRVLPRLAQRGATIGLISETADNRGLLGLLRKAKYRRDRHHVEQKIDFILAMGQLGVAWFVSAGYDPARIFPFAYLTERPVMTGKKDSEGNQAALFRILYLGRVLRLKDGVTAIRALQSLPAPAWHFDVVGDGPDLPRWKKVAAQGGVSSRIHFQPAVDGRLVGNLLQDADLLLLPSRKDGWGAVVNEALMSGVPVICSDNCGAADLLREPWRGATFKAGSVQSLRGALQIWFEGGRRTEESSARIRTWSGALEGAPVARYLVDVVKYVRTGGLRPSPPWY
jgi:glycosyltransferase involved in cell wall biosynthesis